MASTALHLHGARKVTLNAEVITPSSGGSKFPIMRVRFDDISGEEVSVISSFDTKGIVIEDTDNLDVFFVTDPGGKTRLEITLPDSELGIEEDRRMDAKILMAQEQ